MGTFTSDKEFVCTPDCVVIIKEEIIKAFEGDGFQIKEFVLPNGGFELSMTKGGLFKKVVGLQTALKVTANTISNGVRVEAGIGIFGQQALPTIVTMFVFWPVLIPQIWGLIQQSGLDDKVLEIVEDVINRYKNCPECQEVSSESDKVFCPQCGKANEKNSRFCNSCGNKL